MIRDECPKELHIKRGRDYDRWVNAGATKEPVEHTAGRSCKVKFETGTYTYVGNYNVGDIVKVEGAKAGCLGRVIEISDNAILDGLYAITECLGHADLFLAKEIEEIWNSHPPKLRKAFIEKLGLPENTTKKKFVSVMDFKWTMFAIDNNNWSDFIEKVKTAKLP